MKKFRVKAYAVEYHEKLIEADTKEEAQKILQEMVDMNKFGEVEYVDVEELKQNYEEIEVDSNEDLTFPEKLHWFHEGSEEFNLIDEVSNDAG